MIDDELKKIRERRIQQRAIQPVGAFGPSRKKMAAINRVLSKVESAEEHRDPAAYYTGRVPTPERITIALDIQMLHGPEVDRMLGGEEPMVDDWESGALVPDFPQIQALANLTGFPVKFFFKPPPRPLEVWMCVCGGS
jgi:hypothetical protein